LPHDSVSRGKREIGAMTFIKTDAAPATVSKDNNHRLHHCVNTREG